MKKNPYSKYVWMFFWSIWITGILMYGIFPLLGCSSTPKIKIDLPAVMVEDPVGAGQIAHITILNKENVDLNVTIYTDLTPLFAECYKNIKQVDLNIPIPRDDSRILIIDATDNQGHVSRTKTRIIEMD